MSNLSDSLISLSATLATTLSASIFFDQILEKDDSTPWPIVEINLLETFKDHFGAPFLSTYTFQLIYSFSSSYDRLSFDSITERNDQSIKLRDCIKTWYQANIGNLAGQITNITSKHDVYENGEYGNLTAKISRIFTQFQIQIRDN